MRPLTEDEARAAKVEKLLAALDRNMAFAGLPPLAGARGAETVRAFTKRDWKATARVADVKPPSAAVIVLVVEAIEARRPMRKTTPQPGQLALVRKAAS
jgi:hypothetical protein